MTFREVSLSCPVCAEALEAWTLADRRVEGCRSCGGIWIDRSDLAAVLNRRHGRAVELVEFNDGSARHACAACAGRMDQLWFEMLAFEQCAPHGVWLSAAALKRALAGDVMPEIVGPRPLLKKPAASVT